MLTELSAAMVTLFRDFLGKGPDHCKAHWAGSDILMIMLAGGYTTAERTLFAAGRGSAVQESRMALQQTLAERMKKTVEELTGRSVVAFMSASHQEPDLSAEIFVLAPEAQPTEPVAST